MPYMPPIIWLPVLVFFVTALVGLLLGLRLTRKARRWLVERETVKEAYQGVVVALGQTEAAERWHKANAKDWERKARAGKKGHKAPKSPVYQDNRPETVQLPGGQPVPNPNI